MVLSKVEIDTRKSIAQSHYQSLINLCERMDTCDSCPIVKGRYSGNCLEVSRYDFGQVFDNIGKKIIEADESE